MPAFHDTGTHEMLSKGCIPTVVDVLRKTRVPAVDKCEVHHLAMCTIWRLLGSPVHHMAVFEVVLEEEVSPW